MALDPRKSGKFISDNAEFLTIDEKGIDTIVNTIIQGIKDKTLDTSVCFNCPLYPDASDPKAMNWFFLNSNINFNFWTPGKWKWLIEGHKGSDAVYAGINRAMRMGMDITNPKFYANITEEDFLEIFACDNKAVGGPKFLTERVASLHESGKILLEKFDGNFENCVKQCDNSAQKLLEILVKEFPSFRDEAVYKEQRVSFLMRAQLLVANIWSCYRGKGLGRFIDIETLSMFAEYRVPQSLCYFGALRYGKLLRTTLSDFKQSIESGSEMEVEIRGASIHIVELVKKKLSRAIEKDYPDMSSKITSIFIDDFLWKFKRSHPEISKYIPFHKTRSTNY